MDIVSLAIVQGSKIQPFKVLCLAFRIANKIYSVINYNNVQFNMWGIAVNAHNQNVPTVLT